MNSVRKWTSWVICLGLAIALSVTGNGDPGPFYAASFVILAIPEGK